MDKTYKVYRHKYGLLKYEIDFQDRLMANIRCKTETELALHEITSQYVGYRRVGDIEDRTPLIVEQEVEEDENGE